MVVIRIAGAGDNRLDPYRHLADAALRGGVESEHGVFAVEGVLALRQLVDSGWGVHSLLVSDAKLATVADIVERVGPEVPVYVADAGVLAATAGYGVHRGILALGRRRAEPEVTPLLAHAALVAIVEGLNDHENLGALFRNAAAFGVDAVLLDPTCADPLYRRSVRVSLGHVLRVPFARLRPWPGALEVVQSAGFSLLALTPDGDETLETVVAGQPSGRRIATLLGAEGPGLTDAALACVDRRVRIPMRAGTDSLNVATAAAIAWHRLGRTAPPRVTSSGHDS